jgi:ubiquitin-activating enzyme E1
LTEADVGKPRAAVSQPRLAELNQYVPVHVFDGQLKPENLKMYKCVVVTELPMSQQLEINDFCHANNIHFISTEVRGLFR